MKFIRRCRRPGLIVSFAVVGAMFGPGRAANAQETGKPCTNGILNGSYGFYRAGSTASGTLAAVGVLAFDGQGNFSVVQSISKNGDYSFDVSFQGTYEIDADCSGKGFNGDAEFVRIVAIDGGRGVLMLSESAGNAVYGVGTKIRRDER